MVENLCSITFRSGLSLLGYSGLQDIDPVYCMPVSVIERLGLKKRYQLLPKNTADVLHTAGTNGTVDHSGHTTIKGNSAESYQTPALAPALPILNSGVSNVSSPASPAKSDKLDVLSDSPRKLARVTSDRKPGGPRPKPSSSPARA